MALNPKQFPEDAGSSRPQRSLYGSPANLNGMRNAGRREPSRADATTRIMSLFYERDPEEQARFMLETGQRFIAAPRPRYGWPFFAKAVAAGLAIGLAMELYRRFVLTPLFGAEAATPLNIVILQFLPFIALIGVLFYIHSRRDAGQPMERLKDRLEPRQVIDIDVFRDGLRMTNGPVTIGVEWSAMRDISISRARIEFEGESFRLYIPERAFPDRAAFNAGADKFRSLWEEAKQRQMPAATETGTSSAA